MKKLLIILAISFFAVSVADAQLWKLRKWEVEFGVGPSFIFPDVGGYTIGKNLLGFRDISIRQTRFDLAWCLRYRLSRTFNLRLNLSYAMLHSTDTRGSNEGRRLESTTHLFEPAILGEYYFVKNKYESSWLFLKGRDVWSIFSSLDFYAFGGAGVASYLVRGNQALKDRGLRTEGLAVTIPAGIGATLIFSPDINFGAELGGRYAFTDYLDGYTSQYSKANDVYYFLNFTFTYKLKTSAHGLPSFR
jgi:hypothetical protein